MGYTTSKVDAIIKLSSQDHYKALKQGNYESIIASKEKFSVSLQNYNKQGNLLISNTDMAMDFCNKKITNCARGNKELHKNCKTVSFWNTLGQGH